MVAVVALWSHSAHVDQTPRVATARGAVSLRNSNRGRVYRRCACRESTGRQLGARCPLLANRRHGRWAFAVDLFERGVLVERDEDTAA